MSKNSYSFPKYSKKVMDAIESVELDTQFMSFLEKYEAGKLTIPVKTRFYLFLCKLGWIKEVDTKSYSKDILIRSFKAGISDSRRAAQNVLLSKYKGL